MDATKEFIRIFSGLTRAYGQTQSRSKNEAGKLEGRSWIIAEQLTEDKWLNHLAGKEPSLGIIPIDEKNQCTWGAIDIDTYDGFNHKVLIKKIVENKIPLVVCKSKSGGAHVFLFVSEPVLAKDMQIKLKEIAVFLGYGDCEIFPKQIQMNPRGTGNFLNLPYNHPEYPGRFAYDDEGNSLLSVDMFIEHYKRKVVSHLSMAAIEKPTTKKKNDDFKEAPPCLVTLASEGFMEGTKNERPGRNVSMLQLGVYLNQRFPDTLEDKLDKYNNKYFKPPLPSREVQKIFSQIKKEKYFYKCPKSVNEEGTQKLIGDFALVCEKIKCQSRKFGIGNAGSNELGNMKKWVSDDPVWEITHNGKVVVLNKKQLKNHNLYVEECLSQADEFPRPITPPVWADLVQEMIDNMTEDDYIHQPAEVTAKGQYLNQLQIFLFNNKGAKDRSDILQGMVYEHEKGYFFFKPQSLRDFLKTKRFTKVSDSAQYKMFEEFGGSTAKFKVNNNSEHCWKVPASIMESEYNLKEKDFKEEEPY
jgi:hypothetical protein|tara:strand:+ start:691 stop:2271 length:1581 start_codon:yes stop_codon:yes gene_type:complete